MIQIRKPDNETSSKSAAANEKNSKLYLADNRTKSIQKKANNTGLPDNLKSGIENLSGHSMDDVKVHYNSEKPAQLNAHAYAQGTDIHVASGQEKHLAHEAWHVVQQKQGRVKPTTQLKGKMNVNDDTGLEKEADVMGARALSLKSSGSGLTVKAVANSLPVVQGVFKEKGVLYSENALYGIPDDDPHALFVNNTAAPPIPHEYFAPVGEVEKVFVKDKEATSQEEQTWESEGGKTAQVKVPVKFVVFKPTKKFKSPEDQPNDCGMYANALAYNKSTWGKEKMPGEHKAGMKQVSQYDPADSKTKDNLSMGVGDMYHIDWDKPEIKPLAKCGHHAATVVAKDGEDHVTSEADAGLKIAEPIFHLYGTTKDTFWMAHQAYFSHGNQGPPYATRITK